MLRPIPAQLILGDIYLELRRATTSGTDASWRNVKRTTLLECVETRHIQAGYLCHFDNQSLATDKCSMLSAYEMGRQRIGIDKTLRSW